jgi:hypothetical protein
MNKPLAALLCAIFFNIAFCSITMAQHIAIDSSYSNSAIKSVAAFYDRSIGESRILFDGPEYKFASRDIDGDPFYVHDKMAPAVVDYDGITYQDVPAMYDIYKDQLISFNINTGYFSLISSKLKSFSLYNHTFIRLEEDTTIKSPIRTGFYDKIYSGKTMVLAKRTKTLEFKHGFSGPGNEFDGHSSYFIKKDGNYYNVKSLTYFLLFVCLFGRISTNRYYKINKR